MQREAEKRRACGGMLWKTLVYHFHGQSRREEPTAGQTVGQDDDKMMRTPPLSEGGRRNTTWRGVALTREAVPK